MTTDRRCVVEEKKPFKFTVDRARWARGGIREGALLDPEDGSLCCLGFLAKAVGATDDDIRHYAAPSDVPDLEWPEGLLWDDPDHDRLRDTGVCDDIITANDNHLIADDTEREAKLREQFAQIGIEVEFTGEGHPHKPSF
jgi:hypothetical protein